MRTTMIIAATFIGLTSNANAATFGGKSKDVSPTFATRLASVCQSPTMVLTAPAKTACMTGSFPRLTAAGSNFVNTGTGAELNTLMRQLPVTPIVASK